MGRILIKYVIPFLLIVFVCTSIFLLVKHNRLKTEMAALESTHERVRSRGSALQKKYAQERSRRSTLQRTNRALQAEKDSLKKKVEELEKDVKRSKGTSASITRKMKKQIADYKMNLTLKSRQIDGLKAAIKEQTAKNKASIKTIVKRDRVIAGKEKKIKHLGMEIEAANRKINRITTHNQKLCKLGENLLAHLDHKGIFGSILENEPFTQAKRIDLEKMIQDYLDKIDNERLIKSDGFN